MAFSSSLLRPRVIGEWIGREENDADPLAAEMLQPPVPRSKNEQWENEDSSPSPAGRWDEMSSKILNTFIISDKREITCMILMR